MTSVVLCVLISALLCWAPGQAQEAFRLANIYANEMVLQMAPKSTQIWGFGTVGASVNVALSDVSVDATVDANGKWFARLPPQPAGGPFQLTATQNSADTVSINVWFGDVWVCSGQSNMEMPISQTLNPTEETAKAVTYTNLRLMQVSKIISGVEIEELAGINIPWSAPTESNVPGFSALCVMFGERMSDSLGGRPIGLIDTTWGGTRIEAWVSARVLTYCNTPPYDPSNDPNAGMALWNGMVKPLTNMAVRGAIWYQGESNTGWNPELYSCHIRQQAEDWKMTFKDGSVPVPVENNMAFPFGIAQIGPYSGGGDNAYGYLRWHQSIDQGVQPNAYMPEGFMASTYDTTDPGSPTGDIHPRDKQTVADRLANAGKALLLNEAVHANGPVVVSTAENTPGVLTLTYDMDINVIGTGGFSIRRSDGTWADTVISSSSGREVNVNVEDGATHLAYAWKGVVCDYKMCSIYSNDAEAVPAQVWLWSLALQRPGVYQL